MSDLAKARITPPASSEAQAIFEASQQDAGFEKMIKFNKGEYYVDNEEIPLGTQYVAHAVGFTKVWIKFRNNELVERKVYRVASRQIPPEREELDDRDQSQWEDGLDGKPRDPWVLQYLLPLENEGGDVHIFVASSYGGRRAVADLCSAWGRKSVREAGVGQPIIKLRKVNMPSKKWGNVPRPHFEIVGWDGAREGIREVKAETLKQDLDDDIPF